jgi:hypothetical protein
VTKNGPGSTGATVDIDITAIVRAWASGSPNYGVRLRGASETSTADRAPIHSHHAASADRPKLIVAYTYEV